MIEFQKATGMRGARFGQLESFHLLTVDVEDWFHGIPISRELAASAETRLEKGLRPLLDLLEEYSAKATFFVLGPIAAENPGLIQEISERGHEIGCHGWSHRLVNRMSPGEFREETARAKDVIEQAIGKTVEGYRAAYFSISRRTFWALQALVELGFAFDSSIFPVRNWRYGAPDFPPVPMRIQTATGGIDEFPIAVRPTCLGNLPLSGGAYFRLYPYWLTRMNLAHSLRRGEHSIFYIHPWELDPEHPQVRFDWRARATHYANLKTTQPKFERLLRDFSFRSISAIRRNGVNRDERLHLAGPV